MIHYIYHYYMQTSTPRVGAYVMGINYTFIIDIILSACNNDIYNDIYDIYI